MYRYARLFKRNTQSWLTVELPPYIQYLQTELAGSNAANEYLSTYYMNWEVIGLFANVETADMEMGLTESPE